MESRAIDRLFFCILSIFKPEGIACATLDGYNYHELQNYFSETTSHLHTIETNIYNVTVR
ncbi:hypothetical protein GCM10007968_23610 [Sporolactobacillus putidus]|uniref:Uncharacterized protein n=1 Tax=Sporolactobacillus putidus TaxID=492735 RepID=A0A917S669_9BACL|nr:hypothetical protein GCM10007968_23610 [Sporolactobacillus putidus]